MTNTAQHSLPIKKLLSLFIFSVIFFLIPRSAHAATFYISPASATINAGQTKTFSIHINTYGESINAVSPVLAYPSSIVEVTGVTYGNVFNIEAEGSYGKGAIRITRGTTGGAIGDIIIANFTVVGKSKGTASFKFASDSQATRTANSTNALDLANSKGTVVTVSSTGTIAAIPPQQITSAPNPSQAETSNTQQEPVVSQEPANSENHILHVTLKKENGDVLSFVPVTIHPTEQQGVTDKTGTVTFSNLPAGSYTLDATIDKELQKQDLSVNDNDYVQNVALIMSAKKTSFPLIPFLIVFIAIAVVVSVIYLFLKVRAANKYGSDDDGPSANLMPSKSEEKAEPLDTQSDIS